MNAKIFPNGSLNKSLSRFKRFSKLGVKVVPNLDNKVFPPYVVGGEGFRIDRILIIEYYSEVSIIYSLHINTFHIFQQV